MTSYEFMKRAKIAIADYINEQHPEMLAGLQYDWTEIHVVWQCKMLQNHKGIFCTLAPDELLFEVTYNGDKGEMYLDVYDKVLNKCIKVNGKEK